MTGATGCASAPLLALQPEGGSNWGTCGMVRRVSKSAGAAGARRHRDRCPRRRRLSAVFGQRRARRRRAGRAAEKRRGRLEARIVLPAGVCRARRRTSRSRGGEAPPCLHPAGGRRARRRLRNRPFQGDGQGSLTLKRGDGQRTFSRRRRCRRFPRHIPSAASGIRATPPRSRAPSARRATAGCGQRNHRVVGTVRHEDGQVIVGGRRSSSRIPRKGK